MFSITKRCPRFLFAVAVIFSFLAGGAGYANSADGLTFPSPSEPVTMTVDVHEYFDYTDTTSCDSQLRKFQSYFSAELSNVSGGYSVKNGFYDGFCADLTGGIIDYGPLFGYGIYGVNLYSSQYPSSLPAKLQLAGGSYPIPWNEINYLINTFSGDSWLNVQAAIWSLVHVCNLENQDPYGSFFYCTAERSKPFPFGPYNNGCPNTVDIGRVQKIVEEARSNGGNYTPGPGNLVAVVVDVRDCSGSDYCIYPFQIIFIPMEIPVPPEDLDTVGPLVHLTPSPSLVGTSITLTATLDDSTTGSSNIISAEYTLDGIYWYPMSAQDSSFDSPIEDVFAKIGPFSSAGLYDICVRGTDAAGNIGRESCTSLVVFNPTDGWVAGAGGITSPPGAYALNPSLTGKAIFGFYSKYQKGKSVPIGLTDFYFNAANKFNFYSDNYEWLLILGNRAQYKGTGEINGKGNYGFILTAIDGQFNRGKGVDKFRIKIWDKATGQTIYDNKMGAPDGDDPPTQVDWGFITISK